MVEEIATRLARMGHQVTCYNRAGHHVSGEKFDTEKISAYKGVRLKTVPTIEKKVLLRLLLHFCGCSDSVWKI